MIARAFGLKRLCVFFYFAQGGVATEQERKLFGRKMIVTNAKEITKKNIVKILDQASGIHRQNASDIRYLWNYYRGDQPILNRIKKVRPEICNRIVENRANEIVSFKVGYLCGEPIQYVGRTGNERTEAEITKLNTYMLDNRKSSRDRELVEWQMVCGTAYRLVLPAQNAEAPFEIFTLNPDAAYVIYSSDFRKRPLAGVILGKDEEGREVASVYTENRYFEVRDGQVIRAEYHALGMVPVIEYPANNARLGSFEIVLPLLNAINRMASNRMDGVEQFIQSFVKFINCDIDETKFAALKDMGAIKVKSLDHLPADVEIVTSEMNQTQSQVMVDDFYQAVLEICGMPNRNGGSSTSDTGAAVIMRDGWSAAEARAKDSETVFKESEQTFLQLVLRILADTDGMTLRASDVEIKFTRRNYEAIQSKAQVLVSMLDNPKIHPLLGFMHCGMFSDPESAYRMSDAYYRENLEKWEPVEVEADAEQGA